MGVIHIDPGVIQALAPRDEKDVILPDDNGAALYSDTVPYFQSEGRRPFTIACTGGNVSGPSTTIDAEFSGAFIMNEGADHKETKVLTDKGSFQDIQSEAQAFGGRILSLNPYVSSPGEPRKWAAILAKDKYNIQTTVWVDQTAAQIHTNLENAGNLRLIDLRPSQHVSGNTWKYTAVAIPNTGWYQRSWFSQVGQTEQQVNDWANQGWRMIHLAREFGDTAHPSTWCFIAEANPHNLSWHWIPDASFDDINSYAWDHHMRVICVMYVHTIINNFGAILLQNK